MASMKNLNGWQDSLEMTVGLWLLLSPVALGFIANPTASVSAIGVGVAVFLFSQLGIAENRPWEEWTNLILAIVLLSSPWLFGYSAILAATLNASICAIALMVLTIMNMSQEYAQLRKISSS